HSFFSNFELSESQLSTARFRRPAVFYTGDPEELRHNHFLARIDVTSEVRDLLPEVERSSTAFLASLGDILIKIPVAINVGCRACEYRLEAGSATTAGQSAQNGFVECWGKLAE